MLNIYLRVGVVWPDRSGKLAFGSPGHKVRSVGKKSGCAWEHENGGKVGHINGGKEGI